MRNHRAGADCRRSPSGRTQSFPQGQHLPGQGRELHRHAALPRQALCLRPRHGRRERFGRHRRHGSDLRIERRHACGTLSSGEHAQLLASAHPACPGYGRTVRQRRQNQLVDLRRRSRLPGRSGRRLRHGCRRSLPAFRRHSLADRVCGGNGPRTPLGTYVRPGLRTGADPLHRAQRRRRSPCARRQQLCQPLGRPPHDQLRPRGRGDEGNRQGHSEPLPRNLRRRLGPQLYPKIEQVTHPFYETFETFHFRHYDDTCSFGMQAPGGNVSHGHADHEERESADDYLFQTRIAGHRNRRPPYLHRSDQPIRRLCVAAQGRSDPHYPLALRPSGQRGRRRSLHRSHNRRVRPDQQRNAGRQVPDDEAGRYARPARLPLDRSCSGLQHLRRPSAIPPPRKRGLRLRPDYRRYTHLHRRRRGKYTRNESPAWHRHRLPARQSTLHDDGRSSRGCSQGDPSRDLLPLSLRRSRRENRHRPTVPGTDRHNGNPHPADGIAFFSNPIGLPFT